MNYAESISVECQPTTLSDSMGYIVNKSERVQGASGWEGAGWMSLYGEVKFNKFEYDWGSWGQG